MPRNKIVAVVAAAAVVGGGAGAAITTLADDGSSNASPETTTVVTRSTNVANGELTVGQVAKAATKSVVEIDATSAAATSPFPGGQGGTQSAEGTGFVYDTKGDIVT
ncbi:MAG: hypothetical protein ACXVQQ_05725, partial [Gaiellaceae bacterium]